MTDLSDPAVLRVAIKTSIPPSPAAQMEGSQPGQCLPDSFSVLRLYTRLAQLYDKHGADIAIRWTALPATTRRAFLKSSFSKIPDCPIYQWALEDPDEKETERLAPQVNCEQLLFGNSMLLFIQSRATRPPCDFLYSDLDNSQVSPGSGDWIVDGSEDSFCMLFLDKDKEGEYGRIERWEDYEDEFVLPETIGGHGLAIQAHYYPGLVQLCEKIAKFADGLGKVELTPEALAERPSRPMPDQSRLEANDWLSLSELSRRAPLRAPGHLDLHEIRGLVFDRVNDTLDHTAQLWSDPDYFYEYCDVLTSLLAAYEDIDILKSSNKVRKYTQAAYGTVAADAMLISAVWDAISSTLATISSISDAEGLFQVENGKSKLRDPLWDLFLKLELDTEDAIMLMVRKYRLGVMRFQEYHRVTNPSTPIDVQKPAFKTYLELTKAMVELEVQGQMVFARSVMERMQSFVDNEDTGLFDDKMLTDPLRWLSDLAVLMELRRQLRLFTPWRLFWNDRKRQTYVEPSAFLNTHLQRVCAAVEHQFDDQTLPQLAHFRIAKHQTTFRGGKDYAKKQTTLDDLHAQIERGVQNSVKTVNDRESTETFGRVLQDSASRIEWFKGHATSENPPHTDATQAQQAPKATTSFDQSALSSLSIDLSASSITGPAPSRYIAAPRKKKAKTTGTADPDPQPVAEGPEAQQHATRHQYALSQEHYDTMMLTLNAQQGDAGKGVQFTDFLAMMQAVGFTRRRTSAVQFNFKMVDADGELKAVGTHGPHGRGLWETQPLQAFGRKLRAKFGWDTDSFVVAL